MVVVAPLAGRLIQTSSKWGYSRYFADEGEYSDKDMERTFVVDDRGVVGIEFRFVAVVVVPMLLLSQFGLMFWLLLWVLMFSDEVLSAGDLISTRELSKNCLDRCGWAVGVLLLP